MGVKNESTKHQFPNSKTIYTALSLKMKMAGIKVQCRVCQGYALAGDFRLHYEHKVMVCPNCFSRKTPKKEEPRKEEPPKPPGWDSEDEYLQKASQLRKEQNQAQFTKIPGTDYVKCKCFSCKYSFHYNPFKKLPRVCPYCSSEIPKLKTFNLL